jgi:hypothetical protein
MECVLAPPDRFNSISLISLAINLCTNEHNAEILSGGGGAPLSRLVDRAYNYRDSLLLKMIRNLSMHADLHTSFLVNISCMVDEHECSFIAC